MCAGARLLALIIVATPALVGAKPTSSLWVEHVGSKAKPGAAKPAASRQKTRFASPKGDLPGDPADLPVEGPVHREETAKLLGFSRNEAIAAVQVTVRETRAGRTTTYEVIRLLDTATDRVAETFRYGAPSTAPEWQAARPTEAWNVLASRAELASHRLNMEKSNIRMAIDPGDKVHAESNKMRILVRGETGGALGMTPVVRLYDQRQIWLGALRVPATRGRAITAEVEAFHSRTGMHVAVIAHYTSTAGFSEKKTDVVRVYAMPGDPIGTTTIGSFNMTLASEAIGERRFDTLNPGFEEAFDKFGKD